MKLVLLVGIIFLFIVSSVNAADLTMTCGDDTCGMIFELIKNDPNVDDEANLTIGDKTYALKLYAVSSSTDATLGVNTVLNPIIEGETHRINGINYYIEYVYLERYDGKTGVRIVVTNEYATCLEDCSAESHSVLCGDKICKEGDVLRIGDTIRVTEDGPHVITLKNVTEDSAHLRIDGRDMIVKKGQETGLKGMDFQVFSLKYYGNSQSWVGLIFDEENGITCPTDCNGTGYCGNLKCDANENEDNCPMDCALGEIGPLVSCGDGVCNANETAILCPEDCVGPPKNQTINTSTVCGNDVCDGGETGESCPDDCLPEPPPINVDVLEVNQITKEILTSLESLRPNIDKLERIELAEIENGIAVAVIQLESYQEEMNSRDFVYGLTWFFGMQKEQELADVNLLTNIANTLLNYKTRLSDLSAEIDDTYTIIIQQESSKLEAQSSTILSTAEQKERTAGGFIG
ncbi:MAG: hypothetical protein ABIJ92_00265 [Candidatus Aenigmatarchaeota archaeon]